MKQISIFIQLIFLLGFLTWSGCNNPDPVQLVDNQDDSNLIEMKSISTVSDSLYLQSGVDSTGLFGAENLPYFARMIFTGIRFGFPVKDSLVQAEAIFLDRSRPIIHNNRIITYTSFDVGTMAIGTDSLNKEFRWIRFPMTGRDTIIGYQYRRKLTYSYIRFNTYHWYGSGNNGISSFDVSFTPPPEIRIIDIIPQYISTAEPIFLKWKCSNQIVNLIISREGSSMQRTWVPVVHLKIRNMKGEITVPKKVIGILPTRRFQKFLFTFVSDTKPPGTATIGGYGDAMVGSASIHNVILNVKQ